MVICTGPGHNPDMKLFLRGVYVFTELYARDRGISHVVRCRYVKWFETYVYVVMAPGLSSLPEEMLGPLYPFPVIPYVGVYRENDRFPNRSVRVAYFRVDPAPNFHYWTVFRSLDSIRYWRPFQAREWSEADPFQWVVGSLFRDLVRLPALNWPGNLPYLGYIQW